MTMTLISLSKNADLGLYEGTFTISLPLILSPVTKLTADFKYKCAELLVEIVEEIVEKTIDD